jgi:hypothetical protein
LSHSEPGPAHLSQAQAEAEMTHKLTGREIYEALHEECLASEYVENASTKVEGSISYDALALRLNKIVAANGNHEAVVRAITGEDPATLTLLFSGLLAGMACKRRPK